MSAERLKVVHRHLFYKSTSANVNNFNVGRNYKYTLSDGSGILSDRQREFYEENGYIVIPDLFPDQLLDNCTSRFIDICEGRAPRGNITMMKDVSVVKGMLPDPSLGKQALYYKLQDILYDNIFQQFFLHDKLLDVIECFTGSNIMAMHSMLINKPPDVGQQSSRHPPHQDLFYFPFRPANRIVAAWTALEDVSPVNGCLYVLPKSHQGDLLPHGYPNWEGGVNKAFHGIHNMDENGPFVHLPMSRGDTVFFHPLLIHGSGINTTKGYRKAMTCHYASSECSYIDVDGTLQEEMAREIEGMAAKKGLQMTIQDVWKYRARLARGQEINL